jgi:protein-tyrosine-phosphatase
MVSRPPFRVLVLCTGNSARSQIAEALLSRRGAGRIVAVSAGSRPAGAVHQGALDVLRRHGIDWDARQPKAIEQFDGGTFDLLITVCDSAAEDCPVFPGARARVHWGLPDPAAVQGPASDAAFDRAYTALAAHIDRLLELPLETMSPAELERSAASIHKSLG